MHRKPPPPGSPWGCRGAGRCWFMGELTLWVLGRERPAALVVAAARIAGSEPGDLEAVRRGLRLLARLEGWPGRLAGYLLARPEALERAVEAARVDGGPLEAIAAEVLGRARAAGLLPG